jgi:quercetin dioxygenase-like cupin family protein
MRSLKHALCRPAVLGVAVVALGTIVGSIGLTWAAAENGGRASKVFEQTLPNVPGKSLTAVVVDYAPGAASGSHHHAASGFIFAYVVSGAIRSQLEGQPAVVYQTGQSWSEPPGAHHVVSANASATEPARLLAVFVADDGAALTTYDQ